MYNYIKTRSAENTKFLLINLWVVYRGLRFIMCKTILQFLCTRKKQITSHFGIHIAA
jgi:hypothetical protein